MSWQQLFFDPIELPDGRRLRSLRDAGEFIQSLPKAVQGRPEWQVATEALLLVVECDGDPMLARIGVVRALNADKSAKTPGAARPASAIGFSDQTMLSLPCPLDPGQRRNDGHADIDAMGQFRTFVALVRAGHFRWR
jgi:hypothetical protein